jgi:hypothetical protein
MGYIEEWDIIEYDFANNWLQYRADKRGNKFSYSKLTDTNYFTLGSSALALPTFQWGNDQCYDNNIDEGLINQINLIGSINSNTLGPGAAIGLNTVVGAFTISNNVLNTGASITANSFDTGSGINNNILGPGTSISENTLMASTFVSFNTLYSGASIFSNTIYENSIIEDNYLYDFATINNNKLYEYSQISYNTMSPQSSIDHNMLSAGIALNTTDITYNAFTLGSVLAQKTLNSSVKFVNNIVGRTFDVTDTYAATIQYKRSEPGFSNFETSLAIDGFGILDVLNVPPYGILNISSAGADLTTINNLSQFVELQNFRIKPISPLSITILNTGNIDLLASEAPSITLNGTSGDFCDFWTDDGVTAYQKSPANNYP